MNYQRAYFEGLSIFTNFGGSKLAMSSSYKLRSMELRPSWLTPTSMSSIDFPRAEAFIFCKRAHNAPLCSLLLGIHCNCPQI